MREPRLLSLSIAVAAAVALTSTAQAYDRYSEARNPTNCRACHGDFRANNYVSNHDGQAWSVTVGTTTYTSLHDVHRTFMLSGDCNACHMPNRFPVFTNSSTGGVGLQPIGCAGCHGRAGDNVPAAGYSAGLRQHHARNQVAVCAECHDDAAPASYTPVKEDVKPPYYFTPDASHPRKPVDPCNPNGAGENITGGPTGLDNDGNNAYDLADCDVIFKNGFQP